MLKRIIPLVLSSVLLLGAACSLGTLTASAGAAPETTAADGSVRYNYGLHVEPDGTITLEGKPFWGFGLNYFGAFCHYEGGSLSFEDMKNAFPVIAEHNIPFVRLPLGGFYPDYYDRYEQDPESIIAKMQEVLDAAAASRVGVIVSLFWWDAALPEHLGEQRASMGKADSRTVQYAKEYATTVVSRFVNHPAVWGWEIGNEYNLGADLCSTNFKDFLWGEGTPGFPDRERNGYDYYTSDEMAVFVSEVAGAIRAVDGYRMITTGTSEMRGSAWHMHMASRRPTSKHMWTIDWTADTKAQFEKAIGLYTPDPTDTVSFHLQFGTAGAAEPEYVFSVSRAGKGELSVADYFKVYAETAKSLGKGLYFGEFGDFIDMESAPDMPEKFRDVAGWITDAGIQIASLWQYQDFYDTGAGALKYDVLADLNAAFRTQGLQDVVSPWGEHEPVTEAVETAETPTEPESAAGSDATDAPQTETETAPAGAGCASTVIAPVCALSAGAALAVSKRRRKD